MSKLKAPFSIKYQKNLFFKQAGIQEKKFHPIQIQEMTRSFYAGVGQTLVLLRDDVGELPEEEAIEVMIEMLNECIKFWENEKNK